MAIIDLKAAHDPPFPPVPQSPEELLNWAQEFHHVIERWARDVVETIKDVADEIP